MAVQLGVAHSGPRTTDHDYGPRSTVCGPWSVAVVLSPPPARRTIARRPRPETPPAPPGRRSAGCSRAPAAAAWLARATRPPRPARRCARVPARAARASAARPPPVGLQLISTAWLANSRLIPAGPRPTRPGPAAVPEPRRQLLHRPAACRRRCPCPSNSPSCRAVSGPSSPSASSTPLRRQPLLAGAPHPTAPVPPPASPRPRRSPPAVAPRGGRETAFPPPAPPLSAPPLPRSPDPRLPPQPQPQHPAPR